MKKLRPFFIVISIIFLVYPNSFAQNQDKETKNLQSIDILSGFSWGKLKQKGNYNLTPFSVAFNFNLKNLTKKINFNPRPLLQFQVEPFLSLVTKPDNNLETGASFWLKIGLLPETSRLQPYFKLGAGLLYMTQHTLEQSTQFNFTEQLAVGFHYGLSKNTSLTLEGRWRHLSNASIKSPNSGINSYFVLTGISYKF